VLVLKVRVGDCVYVTLPDGRRCRVVVTDGKRGDEGYLKLGFDFPRDVPVNRSGIQLWKDANAKGGGRADE
jgi:hypothetical protein